MLHLPVNWFLQWSEYFFLHGHQYNYTETVPMGKANHHLFYLFMRTIKLCRPCHTFVRGRLQLLRWFFTWTTHLFSRKKLFSSREEPQVIFAIQAKEHFAGACAILVVCQWRKLRFRWSVGYGPLWRMTESSSVIENGLNLLLKNFWR